MKAWQKEMQERVEYLKSLGESNLKRIERIESRLEEVEINEGSFEAIGESNLKKIERIESRLEKVESNEENFEALYKRVEDLENLKAEESQKLEFSPYRQQHVNI